MATHTIDSLIEKRDGVYLDNIRINGEEHLIEYYLNWHDDLPNCYQFQNEKSEVVAVLDITKELKPKLLSKGVFETTDAATGEVLTIQFFKDVPLNLKG